MLVVLKNRWGPSSKDPRVEHAIFCLPNRLPRVYLADLIIYDTKHNLFTLFIPDLDVGDYKLTQVQGTEAGEAYRNLV